MRNFQEKKGRKKERKNTEIQRQTVPRIDKMVGEDCEERMNRIKQGLNECLKKKK